MGRVRSNNRSMSGLYGGRRSQYEPNVSLSNRKAATKPLVSRCGDVLQGFTSGHFGPSQLNLVILCVRMPTTTIDNVTMLIGGIARKSIGKTKRLIYKVKTQR